MLLSLLVPDSPSQVFDITPCEFHPSEAAESSELAFPFHLKICTGQCRTAPKFNSIGYLTSDEFISRLTCNLNKMGVWEAQCDVDEEQDGSLKWSRVSGLKRHGVLWEPGMASPWKPPAAEIPGDRQDHAAYDRLLLKDPSRNPRGGAAVVDVEGAVAVHVEGVVGAEAELMHMLALSTMMVLLVVWLLTSVGQLIVPTMAKRWIFSIMKRRRPSRRAWMSSGTRMAFPTEILMLLLQDSWATLAATLSQTQCPPKSSRILQTRSRRGQLTWLEALVWSPMMMGQLLRWKSCLQHLLQRMTSGTVHR